MYSHHIALLRVVLQSIGADDEWDDQGENAKPNVMPSLVYMRPSLLNIPHPPARFSKVLSFSISSARSPKYPAVSLRLQDLDQLPLTPERCLEYYLDNRMADVPMLLMGLHRRGYLCGYRAFRTADIPSMELPPPANAFVDCNDRVRFGRCNDRVRRCDRIPPSRRPFRPH